MSPRLRTIDIRGPAGRLETILNIPDRPDDSDDYRPRATAVLCHAHPLHGGQMRFKVLYRVSKVLERAGIAVLRFNFRGVGLSEGVYDHGLGEREDLRAASQALDELYPGCPKILGGFSFGAVVASRVAVEDGNAASMLLLGYPLDTVTDRSYLEGESGAGITKLFVLGANDRYCNLALMSSWLTRVSEPRRLAVVDAADHFFTGREDELRDPILAWLDGADALESGG